MKKVLFTLLAFVPVMIIGQTQNENYLLETTYKTPAQESQLPSVFLDDKVENITYYDGLGRPSQVITSRAGGQLENITRHIKYDRFGRQQKRYLPYASNGQLGSEYLDLLDDATLLTDIENFYDIAKYENTQNPYSETSFEPSPLSRPKESAGPGNDWALDSNSDTDHTMKYEYGFNDEFEVRQFSIGYFPGNDPTQPPTLIYDLYYPINELSKSVLKDENWQPSDGLAGTVVEYKNKSGQTVLKRSYNGSSPFDTYYIYDDFGNLIYVLSPKASDQIIQGNALASNYQEVLDKLGYQYRYDNRNRIIEKKVAGKDWEYIIYDKLNRPVLAQDAFLRASNKWLFTKYDALGRVVYTGIHTTTSSRTVIENTINAQSQFWENRTSSTSSIDGKDTYYTNAIYPTNNLELHTLNYYDNYSFDTDGMSIPNQVYGQDTTNELRGLSTGSIVRILDKSDWITSITGYDDEKRAIYAASKNSYLDTEDVVSSLLDFEGKVLESETSHQKGSDPALTYKDYFEYDKMGRVISQKNQISNQPIELISESTYDNLGQLEQKKVGGETVVDGYGDITNLEVYTDGTVEKIASPGWDAGLTTKGAIGVNKNGGVQFTVNLPDPPAGKRAYVGLALSNTTTDPADIKYAFYLTDQVYLGWRLDIYVDGLHVNAQNPDFYVDGTELSVERVGTNIYFRKNGQVIHTATNVANAELIGDAVFYDTGGSISNFELFGGNIDKVLQEIDYTYNVRGWLKEINPIGGSINLLNTDLFHLKLKYNSIEGNAPGEALYNGNIAQTIWQTKNDDVKRGYVYQYDDLNRITEANSRQGEFLSTNTYHTVNNIRYDKNGNIEKLDRRGGNEANTGNAWWDMLDYTYDGNKLLGVVDNSTAAPLDKALGFKDDPNGSNLDYTYDANGNLESDSNKGIINIGYNHLNLPISITKGPNDEITYIYDALGVKQEREVMRDGDIESFQYAGGYVYHDNNLQFFSTPEGYVQKKTSVIKYDKRTGNVYSTSYQYVYQYTDHLGNVRLTYTDFNGDSSISVSEIAEESNYYPFGLKHRGYNNVITTTGNGLAQQWKYNNREFNEGLDVDIYEMDMRQYDPSIARWTTIDPVTHFAYSSYIAFDNNPIFWADPSGADSITITINWDEVQDGITSIGLNGTSFFSDDNFRSGLVPLSELGIGNYGTGVSSETTADGIYLNLKTGKVESIDDDKAAELRGLLYLGEEGTPYDKVLEILSEFGFEACSCIKDGVPGIYADTNEAYEIFRKANNDEVVQLTKELTVEYGLVFGLNILFPVRAGLASTSAINGEIAKKGITILGKYPQYIELANAYRANRFNIPSAIWNKMSVAEQWAANTRFLDRLIARGDKIILSNPVYNIKNVTGYFRQELDYLISKGYKLSPGGRQLIPK